MVKNTVEQDNSVLYKKFLKMFFLANILNILIIIFSSLYFIDFSPTILFILLILLSINELYCYLTYLNLLNKFKEIRYTFAFYFLFTFIFYFYLINNLNINTIFGIAVFMKVIMNAYIISDILQIIKIKQNLLTFLYSILYLSSHIIWLWVYIYKIPFTFALDAFFIIRMIESGFEIIFIYFIFKTIVKETTYGGNLEERT